jgi:hypothetical protein
MEGMAVGFNDARNFELLIYERFNVRVQYLEEITILLSEDVCTESSEHKNSLRSDLFFAVHKEDIHFVNVLKQKIDIRWVEDVLWNVNYHHEIYPRRVFGYMSWDPNEPERNKIENLRLRQRTPLC